MACCAVLLEPKSPNISPVFHKGTYLAPEQVEINNLVDRYWSPISSLNQKRPMISP